MKVVQRTDALPAASFRAFCNSPRSFASISTCASHWEEKGHSANENRLGGLVTWLIPHFVTDFSRTLPRGLVFDHARALPQGDGRAGPTFAGGAEGSEGNL